MISRELAAFVESGVSVQVGTRDPRLVPEAARALGVRVEPGGEEVTVFVPAAIGGPTAANLADNGRVAVCFSRIADHRSVQLKGRATSVAEATDADRGVVDRYRVAIADSLAFIGLPQRLSLRIAHWPCHAIRFRVESVYDQTPGPGAGDRMAVAADGKGRGAKR